MFNEIVVQKEALHLLDEFGIAHTQYANGYYTADSVNASSALIYHASGAGAVIFNCISIEDVVFKNDRVHGFVINWAPVHRGGMHVDPLVIMAKAVLDATGHDCEVARTVERKNNVKLFTETGNVMGERSLSADEAEQTTLENTKEIFPGLFVSGMAANGVSGSWRMGPVFGGMLLSGEKVARLIADQL